MRCFSVCYFSRRCAAAAVVYVQAKLAAPMSMPQLSAMVRYSMMEVFMPCDFRPARHADDISDAFHRQPGGGAHEPRAHTHAPASARMFYVAAPRYARANRARSACRSCHACASVRATRGAQESLEIGEGDARARALTRHGAYEACRRLRARRCLPMLRDCHERQRRHGVCHRHVVNLHAMFAAAAARHYALFIDECASERAARAAMLLMLMP